MKSLSASAIFLTLAGVGVAALGWPPGQVIVEVVTLLTVQSFGIVVAHTPPVYLGAREKHCSQRIPLKTQLMKLHNNKYNFSFLYMKLEKILKGPCP